MRIMLLLAALLAISGCSIERHQVRNPGTSQVIRVQSGDRWYFDLDEDSRAGFRWECRCDDDDVEVRIDHVPADSDGGKGRAEVMLRIHRGYDGPSAVTFRYGRSGNGRPLKTFALSLFKRTSDAAFWK